MVAEYGWTAATSKYRLIPLTAYSFFKKAQAVGSA